MNIETVNKFEQMLTISEVSRIIHVHTNTLRRWSNSGLIKSYRINPRGDRRFRQGDVNDLLDGLRENVGNPHK